MRGRCGVLFTPMTNDIWYVLSKPIYALIHDQSNTLVVGSDNFQQKSWSYPTYSKGYWSNVLMVPYYD